MSQKIISWCLCSVMLAILGHWYIAEMSDTLQRIKELNAEKVYWENRGKVNQFYRDLENKRESSEQKEGKL